MTILGKAAIEAAQALSEKFGIATFDLQGKVNTLPQTRPLDTSINVGSGSTGLTSSALNDLLSKLTPQKPTVQVEERFDPVNLRIFTTPTTSSFGPGEFAIPSQPGFSLTPYIPLIAIGLGGIILISLLKS